MKTTAKKPRVQLYELIERQEEKLLRINDRLGQLMSRRADEENKLADLYKIRARSSG